MYGPIFIIYLADDRRESKWFRLIIYSITSYELSFYSVVFDHCTHLTKSLNWPFLVTNDHLATKLILAIETHFVSESLKKKWCDENHEVHSFYKVHILSLLNTLRKYHLIWFISVDEKIRDSPWFIVREMKFWRIPYVVSFNNSQEVQWHFHLYQRRSKDTLWIHRDQQTDEVLSSLNILRSKFEIALEHAVHSLSDILTNLPSHQQHRQVTE